MSVGDRLNDGEAETKTVRAGRSCCVESLEWLEDPLELAHRNRRAGVGDGEDGVTVARVGCELDASAVDVVVDGVVEEVGDEPFDEARVAGRCAPAESLSGGRGRRGLLRQRRWP